MQPSSRVPALLIPACLLLSVALLTEACGGCPWTSHSAIRVTPTSACLDLSIADSSGSAPSTGCVNPVLVGHNRCGEPLVLPASHAQEGVAVQAKSGERFVFEVALDICEEQGDTYHASVPATLGADSVRIEFDLYAP